MKNNKIFPLLLIIGLTVFGQPTNAQDFLTELVSNDYRVNNYPRTATLSDDGKTIQKYSFEKNIKIEEVFNVNKIKNNKDIDKISGFKFSKDETKILIHTETKPIYRRSFTTQYYLFNVANNKIEPLSENGDQQLAIFSPNGRMIAFARSNNLFLKKLDYNTEIAITKDGQKNRIINGTPDWVYEEEFSNIQYFDFSPDNKLLAYVKFDESEVKEFSFQNINDDYPTLETYKYPKAGEKNSRVSLWVYDIENRTTTQMQIEGEDFYLPRIMWTESSDGLAAVKLSRDQKNIDLLKFNPRSGLATKLYSESSKKTYCDYRNFASTTFNSDGSFVLMSEKDGFRHLYLHDANGTEKQQLTKGEWDVINYYGYDQTGKTAYFQAATINSYCREVYNVGTNGKIVRLDKKSGNSRAIFFPDYKHAFLLFDDINTPTVATLINNSGKEIQKISDNNEMKQKFDAHNLPQKEFFSFTTNSGKTLYGWIIKPNKPSKTNKNNLVMIQYSGPDSQEVLNRWYPGWEYYLADQGFVVAAVDGRGTGARGREFRQCTYGQLGELEASDQIEAANYIKQNNSIDNMAIWGWSYGGFVTLRCMIDQNSPFKAGISIAPVTNWMLYNTAYTERFMNRPQENPDGYANSNLIKQAGNIKGNLLLIHGTSDDNVHAQNSYLLSQELVNSGIEFDMMYYTNKNHSILGSETRKHLYKKCADFLLDKLK